MPGVAVVSPLKSSQAEVEGAGGKPFGSGIDPRTFDRVWDTDIDEGPANLFSALGPNQMALEKDFADANDFNVGDRLEVTTPIGCCGAKRKLDLTVPGIFEDKSGLIGDFMVTGSTIAQKFGQRDDDMQFIAVQPGANVDAVQARVERVLDQRFPVAEVQNRAEFKDSITGGIDQFLALIYALLSLSVIVSLFGIVNTLVLSIHERTREIGMMRAIGTPRSLVRRIVRYESVITALIGAVLGLTVGFILGVVTTVALEDEGFLLSIPFASLDRVRHPGGVGRRAGRDPACPARVAAERPGGAGVRVAQSAVRSGRTVEVPPVGTDSTKFGGERGPAAVRTRAYACARMASLITFEEALELGELEAHADIERLVDVAWMVRQDNFGESTDMCSLVNAKSGGCAEDCGFCAQSKYADAETPMHAMMEPDQMLEHARAAEAAGAHRFCMVTQGQGLSKRDFAKVVEGAKLVAQHTNLKRCASIGHMSADRAKQLKEAGIQRVHHNVETARSYYDEVSTTVRYEGRVRTIQAVRDAGLETCVGGILNLGETRRQRVEMAFELAELDPTSVPINLLNPRAGHEVRRPRPDRPVGRGQVHRDLPPDPARGAVPPVRRPRREPRRAAAAGREGGPERRDDGQLPHDPRVRARGRPRHVRGPRPERRAPGGQRREPAPRQPVGLARRRDARDSDGGAGREPGRGQLLGSLDAAADAQEEQAAGLPRGRLTEHPEAEA